MRHAFIPWNAFGIVHPIRMGHPFMSLEKGWHLPNKLETNL